MGIQRYSNKSLHIIKNHKRGTPLICLKLDSTRMTA